MNEGKRPAKYSGYEPLNSIYGDDGNLYRLYRKVVEENGGLRGIWAAAPHADDGSFDESKMFGITYAQARGFEPIAETNIGKLRRSLGKKLLPQQESYGKKRLSERKNNQPKGKESAKIREIIDILEAPRGLAKKYGYTLTPEYVDINHGGRWPITKLQYNRLKELGYGSTNESYGKKVMNKRRLNERYPDYDLTEWEPEDIELHKSIDWKARNYNEYEVPDDSFVSNVVCYRRGASPEYKRVEFHKFIRPNPIYPPYYAPAENPFGRVVGPMHDGRMHGKYGVHDRYEDQETYDMLSESLNESIPAKAKKEIAGWWKEVEAWNAKKKEFNISNDYNDVEGMHTAMFDMLDELKSRNKDLYEKGRKIYNKYSDVPIKKSKVREAYGDGLEDEDGAPIVTGMDGHRYGMSSSKSVRDSDGFWTDYTAWIDLDEVGRVIFIFGDNDLYDPSNESPDWECDTGENAQEWFDNYEGFDDEDDEDYYGESLNKSLTEADTLARNFKKDIKSRYKSWDSRNDYKNSKRKELKKMLDSSNFPKDKANSIVDIMEPEEKPFEYELPKHLETKDFPFYVTYYEEHPYYHPEEGGYYVAGRYADYSEGFDSKEEAKQFARELANKEGLSRVNDTYYNKPSKYFGEEEHIWVETARDYLSHEKGDTPYE